MRALWIVALMLYLAPSPASTAASSDQLAGDWAGAMDVGGGHKLRFILHLVNTNGAWSGTSDSPDQGASGIPISKVSVDGTKLSFEIPEVGGEYEGTLDKDGKTIMGTWWQNGSALTLNFSRDATSTMKAPDPPQESKSPLPFSGDWMGTLDAGMKLRLNLHLMHTNGVWSGTMDSIDQSARSIPISSARVDGAKVHLELKSIGGMYDGTISADGSQITGTWSQGVASLPLNFTRGDASTIPGPSRPQTPKPPFPYRSEDVAIPGPGGGTLAGTLTLPEGPGPFSVVILISGSGPQDRDESIGGHKPFLVLADHLTRQGIAVLRADDRGTGKSTGLYTTATTEDFAQDAMAMVNFLMSRDEIDSKRIGLAGHSEGGIIAPMVAAKSKDVAFAVLLAGVGVPADEVMALQLSLIMKASGASDATIQASLESQQQMFEIVRAEKDPAEAEPKLRGVADLLMKKLATEDPAVLEASNASVEASVRMVNSPWFRYWLAFDPAATLRQVKQPVLALNGSLDLQVDPKQNLPAIEAALRAGGNKDVTTQELAGLNHLFQTATTGSPTEYTTIEETFSPAAMKVISDWILARTKVKKK